MQIRNINFKKTNVLEKLLTDVKLKMLLFVNFLVVIYPAELLRFILKKLKLLYMVLKVVFNIYFVALMFSKVETGLIWAKINVSTLSFIYFLSQLIYRYYVNFMAGTDFTYFQNKKLRASPTGVLPIGVQKIHMCISICCIYVRRCEIHYFVENLTFKVVLRTVDHD